MRQGEFLKITIVSMLIASVGMLLLLLGLVVRDYQANSTWFVPNSKTDLVNTSGSDLLRHR
jgi:hypothetical protein